MTKFQEMQARHAARIAAAKQSQAEEMMKEIAAHIAPAHDGVTFSVGFVREAYAHLVQAGYTKELASYDTIPTLDEVKAGIERAFCVML